MLPLCATLTQHMLDRSLLPPSSSTTLPFVRVQVARAFKHFDRDDSGTITDDEVAAVLKVCRPTLALPCHCRAVVLISTSAPSATDMGPCLAGAQDQGLSPDDIASLIAEHDTNKDGVIDYQEFLAMMRCGLHCPRHWPVPVCVHGASST